MFPNKYSVYLHDTPSKELFSKPFRSFSSGCIRLEKPLELAEYLLKSQNGWTRERMRNIMSIRKEQTVHLKHSIPVHLLSWTAWAYQEGSIHFRKDIYGRAQLLSRALKSDAP